MGLGDINDPNAWATGTPTLGTAFRQLDDVVLFGAKLDGVTDDSAAVLAALNAVGSAFVPYTTHGIVLNNFALTKGRLYTRTGTNLYAAAGASYAVKMTGFGTVMEGFSVQDTGNTTSQTTTSASASAGATSIVVTSASQGPGIQVGQRIDIELDNGYWHPTYVSTVAGTTIGLYTAIPTGRTVNSGARVWSSFGMIYVTVSGSSATQACRVSDMIFPNSWGGVLVDSPANAAQIDLCVFRNLKWTGSGRMFAIVHGRNANNNELDDVKAFGGFSTSFSVPANGSQTQFSFPDNVFLTREATIQVAGVTKTLGTDYFWVNGSNRTIQFNSAPLSGNVTGSAWSYGVEGIVEDKVPNGSNALPQGGTDFTDCSSLQYQRGWNFRNAQLFSIENAIGDTCSDSAFCFDACTNAPSAVADLFVGWAAVGIRAINGTALTTDKDTWSVMGSGKQVLNSGAGGTSGAAESSISVDATSSIDFRGAIVNASVTLATVGLGASAYMGLNGSQSNAAATNFRAPYSCKMLKAIFSCGTAPGVSNTFTYNVLDKNLSVLATTSITGTGVFNAIVYIPLVGLAQGDAFVGQVVTSASANLSFHSMEIFVE